MNPETLIKPSRPKDLHLNVRISGDDVGAFKRLQAATPGLTDSQRIRDAVRLAAYVLEGQRDPTCNEMPLHSLIDFLGVF